MELRIVKSVDNLMVWGDAMRLEALVYNLLSNAFKYTPDGGKIEVGVLWRDGDKEFRIMVKDNGAGSPDSTRKEYSNHTEPGRRLHPRECRVLVSDFLSARRLPRCTAARSGSRAPWVSAQSFS